MKNCIIARSIVLAIPLASLALSGCGMESSSFGVVGEMPVSESSPPLQGSVYGGHAPLVGARVYVLTPSTSGNPNVPAQNSASLSTSLMASTGTSGSSVPVLDNIAGSPGNGMYYVITDTSGSYNLTGDYSCTQNKPVYLAAVGGTPTLTPVLPTVSITGVPVTTVSGSTATFKYTTTAATGFSAGEYVTVSGYTGTAATDYSRSGFVTTATAVGVTPATFSIVANYAGTTAIAGSPIATAYPGWNPSAINMTALGLCPSSTSGLGFKGTLSYIYTNEVSTAALAVSAGAFGTDAFHIGVLTGTTVDNHYNNAYNKNAVALAINNAGLLYDITGGDLTTNPYGEGHIARLVTPNGNGVAPQALMDTLGNLLATCVDDPSNTGTTANVGSTCEVLFANATNTGLLCAPQTGGAPPSCAGVTGTTAPTDIATAAFNIAHHPAGTGNTSFVKNLYTLTTGTVPFTPNLTSNPNPNGNPNGQPNDFTATIAFTVPTALGSTDGNLVNQPQVISIDGGFYVGDEYPTGTDTEAAGDYQEGVWVGNFGSQAVELFANGGIPDYAVNTSIKNATFGARSVAIDGNASAENVWFVNPNVPSLVEYSIGGTAGEVYQASTGADALNVPLFAVLDSSTAPYDIFIPQYSGNNLLKIGTPAFGPAYSNLSYQCVGPFCGDFIPSTTPFSTATPCLTEAASAMFDPTGTLYTFGEGSGDVCTINTTSGAVISTKTGFTVNSSTFGPAFFSVDHSNTVWGANAANNTLISYKVGVAPTTHPGGGINTPCSTAVDGGGNIWVGNAGTYGVSEFTSAGAAISPPPGSATLAVGGYSPQINATYYLGGAVVFSQQGTVSNCASPAIDRAGNVWVVYQGNANTFAPGVIFEILGAATPTVTPLSYATFGSGTTGYLGSRP